MVYPSRLEHIMTRTPLQEAIVKIRGQLEWPVIERSHDQPVVRIASQINDRSHLILQPGGDQAISSELDYLHELGHATFCERVHPAFAGNAYFTAETDKRKFLAAVPALTAAQDWFIGHWMMEMAPDATLEQMRESLAVAEEVVGRATPPAPDSFLDASLLIAQSIRYLEEPIDCGGILKTAVDAFLDVPPEKPAVEALIHLINSLMLLYTLQQVRLTCNDGYHLWEVLEPGGTVILPAHLS